MHNRKLSSVKPPRRDPRAEPDAPPPSDEIVFPLKTRPKSASGAQRMSSRPPGRAPSDSAPSPRKTNDSAPPTASSEERIVWLEGMLSTQREELEWSRREVERLLVELERTGVAPQGQATVPPPKQLDDIRREHQDAMTRVRDEMERAVLAAITQSDQKTSELTAKVRSLEAQLAQRDDEVAEIHSQSRMMAESLEAAQRKRAESDMQFEFAEASLSDARARLRENEKLTEALAASLRAIAEQEEETHRTRLLAVEASKKLLDQVRTLRRDLANDSLDDATSASRPLPTID